ncbi:MAG: fumarate/nitrate reduction transcriptional regulator Fnr [Burkholderiaceae bacterium]|nr:fumarate/nitrate reduction transcriptional regulator Fnr [Burkholderiaceae bacterium]
MPQFVHLDSTPSPLHKSPHPVDTRSRCTNCAMQQRCLPSGLSETDTRRLDSIMVRHRVWRNDLLYRMGDRFASIYVIRLGHFKTYQVNAEGVEQITGFPMSGDFLGMDAIGAGCHPSFAVALEDSELCEIPFARLETLFSEMPALLRRFHRSLGQEISREQNSMLLMGNLRAEQRFASFLVNVSRNYRARGFSPTSFVLRMTRQDIGNYLGLTIESISRLLTKFARIGWIRVNQREIELLDLPRLTSLVTQKSCY